MATSEELVYRSNVYLTACKCVVDVAVTKGSHFDELQVAFFERQVATDVPPLILDYPAIVMRLAKNGQQTQLNVVLDSSIESSDVEHLRTLIRNKAIFDFVVSGLHVVYDPEEMKIVNVDSRFAIGRTNLSKDFDQPRFLSKATSRVSSFFGKMLSGIEDSEAASSKVYASVASSKAAASTKAMTYTSVTRRNSAEHEPSTATVNSPDDASVEPIKTAETSVTPAKRLAQYFLKRMNSSTRHLTDSNCTLATDAMESAKTNTEVNCDTQELPQQPQAPPSLASLGVSTEGEHSVCAKHHLGMRRLQSVRHLAIDTDLVVRDCCDEEDEWQSDNGSCAGGVNQAGDRARTVQQRAAGAGSGGGGIHDNGASCAGGPLTDEGALEGSQSTKPAVAVKSPDALSWWLGAIFKRTTTKTASVYAE